MHAGPGEVFACRHTHTTTTTTTNDNTNNNTTNITNNSTNHNTNNSEPFGCIEAPLVEVYTFGYCLLVQCCMPFAEGKAAYVAQALPSLDVESKT